MSRYIKIPIIIIILEIIAVIIGNVICFSAINNKADKNYLVQAKRIQNELESDPQASVLSQIDKNKYPDITDVRLFNDDDASSASYVVINAKGKQYRVEYAVKTSYMPLYYMNIGFGMMMILTFVLFFLVYRKIIRPFSSMEKLATELAKGNLSQPVKEEKSKVFGKFLWSMDMLREKLEENKEKELAYQKEKKMLMLSLSHDIKTPLSAIELYTRALSTELYDSPEKKKEAYDGIEKNLKSLSGYIEEITAASRDDFLMLEVREDEIYLDSVINKIDEYYSEKFTNLHTDFSIEEHGNPLIVADENRLVEVIQNILENAIKYGDGREVNISFSEEEDAKLIHIKNSGTSPAENEMVHLFDSFYRAANAKNKKGSGLGLYISKQLMKLMSGDIYATAGTDVFEMVVVVKKA